MKKLNWKLVCGLCVITAVVVGSLFYRAQVSPEVINQQTNTIEPENIESENKNVPKSPENKPSPYIKENTKVVKDDTVTPADNALVITEKDFGQYFTPSKGQQVFLRLSNNFSWIESEPKTTGTVMLSRINQDKNQAYREWQLSFPAPSTVTIESNISTGTLGTDAEITRFFVTIKSK